MKKRRKIIMSIMLCIVLFGAMFVSSVFMNVIDPSTNVRAEEEEPELPLPPDEPEPSPPAVEEYNLYISGINAYSISPYPEIIFVNIPTIVECTLGNIGQGYISDVMVDVYEVIYEYIEPPEGNLPQEPYTMTENYIMTLSYDTIPPGGETTKTVSWTPTQTGEYELRLGMSYIESTNNVEYEDGEIVYVARGDLPIMEINEDWIITEDTTMQGVIILLDGDIFVTEDATLTLENGYMIAGDLIIESGAVVFIDFNLNMGCTFRGQYKVWVMHRGTLMLRGSTVFNSPSQFTFRCEVDGILICSESPATGRWSEIRNVWGSQNTGGIELRNNNPAKQSSFRRTIVRDCDSIGIGCYGSSPTLFPYVAVYYCGSSWGTGRGVYVQGATANPLIQWSWLIYNARTNNFLGHGIELRDAGSATILGCYIYRNTWSGVYCYYSSSGIAIQSNSIYYNRYYGILCYYSTPTIENNWIAYSYYGIISYRAEPTIKENTIYDHYYGILCYYTPSPIVDGNNLIRLNDYMGIYMYRSTAEIKNNEIIDNGFAGIYMSYSAGVIQYNTIDDNGWTWVDNYGGISCYYSTPTIKDNDITNNDGWGIWMRYGALTNEATIGTDNTYVPNNRVGRVWQQWWLQVLVKDLITGNPASGASVSIYDIFGTLIWSGTTSATGYTPRITVTEYQINNAGTTTVYTPHRVVVSFAGRNTTQWVTVDDNMITVVYI